MDNRRCRRCMKRSLQLLRRTAGVVCVETTPNQRNEGVAEAQRCPVRATTRDGTYLFMRKPTMPLVIGDLFPIASIQMTPARTTEAQTRRREKENSLTNEPNIRIEFH